MSALDAAAILRTRGVLILNTASDVRHRSAPKAFSTNSLWLRAGRFRSIVWLVLCIISVSSFDSAAALAQEPLHVRINQIVEKSTLGPRGEKADDLAFLRRIHLDLAGRIPTVDQSRAFLADTSPDKRAKEVDRLLASPGYARHMALVFDVMLMERRGGVHVKSDELRAWLRTAFEQNRPYREIARDFIAADGTPEKQRAASAFFLERTAEPNLMTREVGRMFFGIDLQCAQCHDHPNIDDYLQTDYYGLYAFVGRTSLFRPDAKKPALLAESPSGVASFKSVFTDRQAITGPRAPGSVEVTEAVFSPGDEYKIRPAKTVRGIPKFSRREKLAELIGAGGNRYFDRNIANRLWAIMLGRGLVHPVDQHHSDNPPTIPELLDLLSTEFAKSDYNMRSLLREIALTDIYQRSFQLPADLAPSVELAQKSIPELKQLAEATEKSVDEKQAQADALLEQLDAALAEARPLRVELGKAVAAGQAAAKKRNDTATALAAKKAPYDAKQKQATAVSETAAKAKAAAAILTSDTELAAAVKTLEAKAAAFTAEATKLKAAVDAAQKPATAAEAALAVAAKAIEPHRAKLDPSEAKILERRAAFIAAQRELYSERESLRSTERRISFLEALVTLDASERQVASLTQALPIETQAAALLQKEAVAAQTALTAATAAMKTAAQTAATTGATLATTTKTLTENQTATKLVGETLVSARASLKQLPQDPDLAQAVAKLDVSAARIAKELAAAQQVLPAQSKAAADAKTALASATAQMTAATTTHQASAKKNTEAAAKLTQIKEQLAAANVAANESSAAVIAQATSQFNIAYVDPLTPEQLAVSMMQATGRVGQLRAGEAARINKAAPLKEADLKDAAKVAAREKEIDEATWAKALAASAGFVNLFAGQKGQPQDAFFATVDQALFFANGGDVRTWLTPSGTNLTARALKLEDPKALAEELYLSLLTRLPTDEEVREAADYLAQRKEDRSAAVQEITWALITSSEFRFHH
jgi:hypothetical protein